MKSSRAAFWAVAVVGGPLNKSQKPAGRSFAPVVGTPPSMKDET